MSKNKNYEFERDSRPEDDLANGYFELEHSHEYGDENKYSIERLRALAEFWDEETINPLRSPRGQREAQLIVDRINFECAYRHGRVAVLQAFYNPVDVVK